MNDIELHLYIYWWCNCPVVYIIQNAGLTIRADVCFNYILHFSKQFIHLYFVTVVMNNVVDLDKDTLLFAYTQKKWSSLYINYNVRCMEFRRQWKQV